MSDNTQSQDTYSEELLKIVSFSERIPYAQKMSNNGRWVELRANALDMSQPDVDPEYLKRVEDNFRLIQGDPMINFTHKASREARNSSDFHDEGIDSPYLEIDHYDVVFNMIEGLTGDQQRRRFKVMVTDSSIYTQNYIKDQKAGMLKTHFEQNLINPARQQAMMQWQIDNQVQDIFSLSPEQRQQMQSDVSQRVENLIPKDIMMFLKTGSKGNLEKQGQALAEALIHTLDLKFKADQIYKESFATDGMIFHTGIRHNMPFADPVDLTGFNTGGANDFFIDNNPWFKKVRKMHPTEIVNQFGIDFNRTDWKKFNEMVKGKGETDSNQTDRKFTNNIALDFEGQKLMPQINMLRKDGQEQYREFLNHYDGLDYGGFAELRVAHLVWSSFAKMQLVTRGYKDGTIRDEWFSEDYEFNPANGDLEVSTEWAKQYWECEKIGQTNPIFVNKRPVQVQYRDITNPFTARSCYTGAYFDDLRGKGKRKTPLDIAKPYIHGVNFQMKVIKDKEATDIGKVVLMTVAAKPEGWSWGKLIEVVRATKFLPINTQRAGLTQADMNFFKEIDLSNMYDIIPRINYLNFQISQIANILGYNAARAGTQAASTSVGNNQSNLSRAFSQTHNRTEWYNKIMEHLLENLIYCAKHSVKDGNIFLRYVLDDLSIATIDLDMEEIDDAYFGVKVLTDEERFEQLDLAKNYVLPYLQNPNNQLGPAILMRAITATSRGEVFDIMAEAELELDMKRAQAADVASKQQQDQQAYQKDIMQLKAQLDQVRDQMNNEAKKDMAAIQSMTIANANDIDHNQQNDYLESADKERDFKREQLYVQDAQKRDQLDKELEIQKEELALQDKWNLAGIKEQRAKADKKP